MLRSFLMSEMHFPFQINLLLLVQLLLFVENVMLCEGINQLEKGQKGKDIFTFISKHVSSTLCTSFMANKNCIPNLDKCQ